MEQEQYTAFISYSRADEQQAKSLQSYIEHFKIPHDLKVSPPFKAGKRVPKCFRDRDELPASSNLGEALEAALAQSSALVVVASPHAAASKWVNAEIAFFKSIGRGDQIFYLVTDGEPLATKRGLDPALEALPPAAHDTESVWIDLRQERKKVAFAKIIAGILSVGADEIIKREQRRRRERFLASFSLMSLLTVTVFVGFQYQAQQAKLKLLVTNANIALAEASVLYEKSSTHQAIQLLLQWVEQLDQADQTILKNNNSLRRGFDEQLTRLLKETPRQEVIAKIDHKKFGIGTYAPSFKHQVTPNGRFLGFDRLNEKGKDGAPDRPIAAILDLDKAQLVYKTPPQGHRPQYISLASDGSYYLNCHGTIMEDITCEITDISSGDIIKRFTNPRSHIVTHGTQAIGPAGSFALFPYFDSASSDRAFPFLRVEPVSKDIAGQVLAPHPDAGALQTEHVENAQIEISEDGNQIAVMAPGLFYLFKRDGDHFKKYVIKGAFSNLPKPQCCNNQPSFSIDFESGRIAFGSIAFPLVILDYIVPKTSAQNSSEFIELRTKSKVPLPGCESLCSVIGFLEKGRLLLVSDNKKKGVIVYALPEVIETIQVKNGISVIARFNGGITGLDQSGNFARAYEEGISYRYHFSDLGGRHRFLIRGYKDIQFYGWINSNHLLLQGYNGNFGLGPPPKSLIFDITQNKVVARHTVNNLTRPANGMRAGNNAGIVMSGGSGPRGPFQRFDANSGSLVPVPIEIPEKTTYASTALFFDDDIHACVRWRDPYAQKFQTTIVNLINGQQIRLKRQSELKPGLLEDCTNITIESNGQKTVLKPLPNEASYPAIRQEQQHLFFEKNINNSFRSRIKAARKLIIASDQ